MTRSERKPPARRRVRTADRTLDLLELFGRERRPLAVVEIARLVSLPLSSCLALVRTVQRRGYLYATSQRGPLYPTDKIRGLAEVYANHQPLPEAVFEALARLGRETRKTVAFGYLMRDRVVYLRFFHPPHALDFESAVGRYAELHTAALAKAILGMLPGPRRAEILARHDFRRRTPHTRMSAAELEKDIALGNRRGWHVSVQERFEDAGSVAKAFTIDGVIYGIALSATISSFRRPRLEALAEALEKTRREIVRLTRR